MQWNAELRTWLPLDPPSDFPRAVAEIAIPSVQASVADSEIRIQVSDSVLVQHEYPINYTVLSMNEEVFTGVIEIPSGGVTRPVTDFRSKEHDLCILDEIDLSLELAGCDSPCAISIPPGVPDELQPNFNLLEISTREDGCPILRLHRDTSIETDIGFKPHYDVELTSESVTDEVEAYLGRRDCDLELTNGRLVRGANLEPPPESCTLDLKNNIINTPSGSHGLRAWVESGDDGDDESETPSSGSPTGNPETMDDGSGWMYLHGVPPATGILSLQVEFNREDPFKKPFPFRGILNIPSDTQYVIIGIDEGSGAPAGYSGGISSARIIRQSNGSTMQAVVVRDSNQIDSATTNYGVVVVPGIGKVRWEKVEANYSGNSQVAITGMLKPPFGSFYEVNPDSNALVLQRIDRSCVDSIWPENGPNQNRRGRYLETLVTHYMKQHPNDYQ